MYPNASCLFNNRHTARLQMLLRSQCLNQSPVASPHTQWQLPTGERHTGSGYLRVYVRGAREGREVFLFLYTSTRTGREPATTSCDDTRIQALNIEAFLFCFCEAHWGCHCCMKCAISINWIEIKLIFQSCSTRLLLWRPLNRFEGQKKRVWWWHLLVLRWCGEYFLHSLRTQLSHCLTCIAAKLLIWTTTEWYVAEYTNAA